MDYQMFNQDASPEQDENDEMKDQIGEPAGSDDDNMPKIPLLEDDGADQEEFDYADGKKDSSLDDAPMDQGA